MLLRDLVLVPVAMVVGACGLGQPPTGHATGSPSAAVVLVAEDLAFHPSSLRLPGSVVVGLTLDNRDPGILHNVTLLSGQGEVVFRGETFAGIEARTYIVAPLSSGEFRFVCDVHPTMTGTITVDASP